MRMNGLIIFPFNKRKITEQVRNDDAMKTEAGI